MRCCLTFTLSLRPTVECLGLLAPAHFLQPFASHLHLEQPNVSNEGAGVTGVRGVLPGVRGCLSGRGAEGGEKMSGAGAGRFVGRCLGATRRVVAAILAMAFSRRGRDNVIVGPVGNASSANVTLRRGSVGVVGCERAARTTAALASAAAA